MPSSVSVPEKTLEHWSSQYVMYRYRAQAALWWPTRGEDIDVRWLPTRPGKAVQVELKTTTVVGAALHDVWIDLGQLWEYCHRPLGHQPFYAFPWPDWRGNLAEAVTTAGRSVTELGLARSGSGWFSNWMVVLTAAQVAAVLRPELTGHGSRERGAKERLARFDLDRSAVTWGPSSRPEPLWVGWLDFWAALEQCGRDGWPQLIRVPARSAGAAVRHYTLSDVAEMLGEGAGFLAAGEWYDDEPLVTLEPNDDGTFQIAKANLDDGASRNEPTQAGTTEAEGDNRLVVFLEARSLLSQG